jgi:hypothetical protein
MVHPDSLFIESPRRVLLAWRIAKLLYQPCAVPRVRLANLLLAILRAAPNRLPLRRWKEREESCKQNQTKSVAPHENAPKVLWRVVDLRYCNSAHSQNQK